MTGRRWFVVQTWPGREYRVRAGLERVDGRDRGAEVEPFLPECTIVKRYRRHGQPWGVPFRAKVPLFPGYLLVRFDPTESWGWLLEFPCISDVIRHGDDPAPLPDGWAEALRSGGPVTIDEEEPRRRWTKGQLCRIVGGPFAGCIGLYDGSVKGRIRLLLDILGRPVPVETVEALVTPA